MTDCYTCRHNELPAATLPSRERVFDDGVWRVAHALSAALPGWMVVLPRRHVLSMAELNAEEAASLGPLLAALSRALERTRAARKAYVAFFAEAPGFEHLHVHVIPRGADLPADRRGPQVFSYLSQPVEERVSSAEMDSLADRIRPLLDAEVEALSS
jgi:diadenosine tetraphosphate (Ap4A) HIT family hydrolase